MKEKQAETSGDGTIDKFGEGGLPEKWPQVFETPRAIAEHVSSLSDYDVDEEFIEEHFFECGAVLRLLPVEDLQEGDPNGNVACDKKAEKYKRMPIETMPPILCENGIVEDGNHRLRDARARGLSHIWAYVVMPINELPKKPVLQNPKRRPRP